MNQKSLTSTHVLALESETFKKEEVNKMTTTNTQDCIGELDTTNTDGPEMEPSTGATGGTGGSGGFGNAVAAGGTGGTGGNGGPGSPKLSFEDVAKEEAFNAFFGATGGIGGIPDDIQAIANNGTTVEDMMKVFHSEINMEMDIDHAIQKTKEAHADFVTVETNANIASASRAYIAGKWFERTRDIYLLVEKKKGWIKFAMKTFPEVKKSTRENHINVASVPSASKHFKFGVTRLAEFGSYLNSLDSEALESLGDDPITELAKGKVDLSLPLAENMSAVNALAANYKLEKRGIIVSWDTLHKFYEEGLTINSTDSKHLHDLVKEGKKKEDLDAYLESVMEKEGDRNAVLQKDASKKEGQVRNIDAQVLELIQTFKGALKKKLKGKVDPTLLNELRDLIDSYEKSNS